MLARLGVAGSRRPCEATTRRVLTRVDGELLDGVVGAWMRTRVGLLGGQRIIAIDGKTVRGARAGGQVAPHLVATLDHTLGVVLGQVQVAVKSNEIPALRTLLEAFDLFGAVITADAMHTQTTTAAYVTARGGHYVFTVKANQPGLFARCRALPWAKIRAVSSLQVGHGRRVRRTIKVAAAPVFLDFAGAVQVAQLRRTRTVAGKKSVEVVYVITSIPSTEASPLQIATWVQAHWSTREQASLGPRRRLRRRPLIRANRERTPGHGDLALDRDQHPAPDRHHHHRPRDPTSRPRRQPTRPTTADLLKHDFAGTLGTLAAYSPSRSTTRRRSSTSRLRRPGRISTPFSPLDSPSPLTSPTSAVAIAC